MESKTLTDRLAKNLKRSKKDVNDLVAALCRVVEERCGELDTIAVPGFGNLAGIKSDEHVVSNNDSATLIPPKVTLQFEVSNILKNKLK